MTEATKEETPRHSAERLIAAIEGQVLGQKEVVGALMAAYAAGGHVLLEGMPGLGKTLLARTFAACLGVPFRRVQFTPDLMPADLLGTNVFDSQRQSFRLLRGPVFTQVLMADEINRTPPKTQAALLEAMEEGQVTIDGVTHPLPAGFFVIATQNPIELEGVYPLPEAQLDRFLMRIRLDLPVREAELEIYRRFLAGTLGFAEGSKAGDSPERAVVPAETATALRRSAEGIHVADELLDYLWRLAEAVRKSPHLDLGVSPRGALALLGAARSAALLEGREFVLPDDLKRFLPACWGHRVLLRAESELEGHTVDDVLVALVEGDPVPHKERLFDDAKVFRARLFGALPSPRNPVPSARLLGTVGLLTLLLAAGLLVPWFVPLALLADAVLLAAFVIDQRRAAGEPLVGDRQWPPMLVQGADTMLRVEVASRSRRSLTVRLRDGLAPALAPQASRTELTLAAGGSGQWEQRLVPRRRGEHEVAPLTARVLGPWSLAWAQRDLVPPEAHRIFPQVRWGGRVGQLLALAQRRSLGVPDRHLLGLGSEPYALREYLPGDPLNRIHWKATARHGRLVSREETWERGARLVILLDAARTMASMDGARSKLDHALAAALALTRVASARGDQVTVIVFSDRVERVVRASSRMAEVYGQLYDCEARLSEPAYDLAVEAALRASPRQATVMLFTSVVDLAAGELLRGALLRLEQRRHRPVLLNLQDPELGALADEPPEDVPEAYAQATALEILLENRRLTRRMRAAGVRMVQPVADRLALSALDSYLEIFRRAR